MPLSTVDASQQVHRRQPIREPVWNPLPSATGGSLTSDVDTAARTVRAASDGVLSLFMQGMPAAEIKPASELLFDALMAKPVRSE
jgi:hypothetical protein